MVTLLAAVAGGACMGLGAASNSLGGTIAALVGTAAAGMGASGAVWGVAPFLATPTALGVVAGIVGAAGPVGECWGLLLWLLPRVLQLSGRHQRAGRDSAGKLRAAAVGLSFVGSCVSWAGLLHSTALVPTQTKSPLCRGQDAW